MAFYRRNLPHLQFVGAEYFVTFRLYGSLPGHVIMELNELRKQLGSWGENVTPSENKQKIDRLIRSKFESYLDKSLYGPQWLRKSSIAEIVEEAIHFRNGRLYELYAYSIMSNHVHMVFRHIEQKSKSTSTDHLLLKDFPVTKILADLKKFTAGKCNRRLGRSGHFWQAENFDRLIRNHKELENCIRYTLNNPVKAGLVEYWDNWPHSYCKPEFVDSI